ncbi:MAG: MarR family transcriptional regulator [Actinomycetota bacterium]|nr:MarR family transcriptional regulator [Euzebyales bacterium]MDQ3530113.1 MarR family transcriptional regulator [Actinomycetota bacterium]
MPSRTAISTSTPAAFDADTANRLRLVLVRLARRLRQQADTGATPSQLSALSTLDRRGPLPLGELAAAEGIGPSTLTRIVAALERDDLVERTAHAQDRRVAVVAVTIKGRRLLDSGRSRGNAYLARRVEALQHTEVATLITAVDILERLLEDDA